MTKARISKLNAGLGSLIVIAVDHLHEEGLTQSQQILAPAELAVAQLAAEGMSDAEIAKERDVSARTVANQLRSVYRKLGLSSRVELVRKLEANLDPPSAYGV